MYKTLKALQIIFTALLTLFLTGCTTHLNAQTQVKIMPLGDSITAGYTDNPKWKHPFEYGYRSGLYRELKKANINFSFVGGSKEPFNIHEVR